MRRIIVFFLIFLGAIWIGTQLSRDPGYVLIAISNWTIETTAWVALIALVLFFVLLYSFLTLYHAVMHFPERFRHWKMKRRAYKAQNNTRQGLIEFSEGHWSSAKNYLIRALPNTDTPLFNYLTAARAAQELGDLQLRDTYLREAQQAMPDAKMAVTLTQAQLQLANQQWEQALATLRHLHDMSPRHPYVLKLLMHLYQEVKDWPQLIKLLPELKKNQVIDTFTYKKLAQHTYLQAMLDLIKLKQGRELHTLFQQLPSFLKYDAQLTTVYSYYLIRQHEEKQAEPLLRTCLQKNYDERLIALYGTFFINTKQLSFAESLLKKHLDSAALYLCLSKLCSANHLWGKAKTYIDHSIILRPSIEAYQSLGELFEHLGEMEKAREAYRQGLALYRSTLGFIEATTLSEG